MHISRLQLLNYRNFERANFYFKKNINTIIGENGSGKTNVFRAIRLLLDDSMPRSALRLEERDFHRSSGDWRGHWIVISLQFEDISEDESIQALFLHQAGALNVVPVARATLNLLFRPNGLIRRALSELPLGDAGALQTLLEKITILDYEPILTGRSDCDFTDPAVYRQFVGDFDAVEFPAELNPAELGTILPNSLSIQREVCFTYVQALRDVVAEFHNTRTNPLFALLRAKSGEIDRTEFQPIVDQVGALNNSIEALTEVAAIRNDIHLTINETAGDAYSPASLSIRSDLPYEAEKLFQSLKLFVGETDADHEDAIHELSLGGANLIFLTLKLLQFKYQRDRQSFANFLLIEEPEAHIHTHIQKTLFDRLQYPDTQVIYSTHSPHISEVSNVKNVNILARVNGACEVYQPSTGLTTEECDAVQRYLDAVRCSLLFARSVMLVEGDVEEILIPAMVKAVLGISLDELGISLINVRSTGFENVGQLFHDSRIKKRCSIVTDLDAIFFDVNPIAGEGPGIIEEKRAARASAADGEKRKIRLDAFAAGNPFIQIFYASHTFEVDLIHSTNSSVFVRVLPEIYTQAATIAEVISRLRNFDIAISGKEALRLANKDGKGWLAIRLARHIDSFTVIPAYILNAIFHAHGPIPLAVLAKITRHRIKCNLANGADAVRLTVFDTQLSDFEANRIDIANLRKLAAVAMPTDALLSVLEKV